MTAHDKSRLLVVEDEAIVMADVSFRLKKMNYEVVATATCGEEALLLAEQFRPDLVLMDIHLQGQMDGITAARELRARFQIPVVFLTAYSEESTFQRAKAVGPLGYILKPFSDRELHIVIEMAVYKHQAELLVSQSKADLRVLAARLQAVREEERASLARELHDLFGQHLTALQIDLMWMDRHLQSASPLNQAVLSDKIVAMVPIVERLTEQTQTLCASLRPNLLYDLGLLAAIEWQAEDAAKRSGLRCKLSLPAADVELADDLALALYRVVQESLVNVSRHAQATQVEVILRVGDGELELEILDDGRGFPPDIRPDSKSLGLLGMRERIETFGGTVEFLNNTTCGACVRMRVPIGSQCRQPRPS